MLCNAGMDWGENMAWNGHNTGESESLPANHNCLHHAPRSLTLFVSISNKNAARDYGYFTFGARALEPHTHRCGRVLFQLMLSDFNWIWPLSIYNYPGATPFWQAKDHSWRGGREGGVLQKIKGRKISSSSPGKLMSALWAHLTFEPLVVNDAVVDSWHRFWV